jgi:site-specific recombinase XerD
MATIKLKFRASTVAGKDGVLYYQLIHHRIARQIATEYRIPQCMWNDEKQIVLDTTIRHRTQYDIERINRMIERLMDLNPNCTADDIVREYCDEKQEYSLFNYMPKMVARRRQLGKTKTADGYQCALNSFMRFRENKDVMLHEITPTLMEDYQEWLKNNGIQPNTISFYMRKIRATYNQAVEDEIIADRRPFKRVFTGNEKTRKRALPAKELSEIKDVDLSKYPKLDFARDMFLMSFYLRGMSYVDMAFLKKSDLKSGVVTYRRRKTNQSLHIQWTADMQRIVDKYMTADSDYLLPIIGRANREWKDYVNNGHKINYHLKRLAKLLNISSTPTLLTARHSWATIAHNKGVNISVISEGLGHNSERTTHIYLASLDSSTIDKANRLVINAI